MSDLTSRLSGWMDFANPTRFVWLADKVVPWLATIAALILAAGLYMSFAAPEDFQPGEGHMDIHDAHGDA
ncbi:MAG: hypothetical protein E5W01_02590, partial [Mesorhizobium sp.]